MINENAKSLLVLCCHPPSLDPRIKWSAEFGQKAGYATTIAGFHHEKKGITHKLKASDAVPETIYTPKSPRASTLLVVFMMIRHGILPIGWALFWAILGFIPAILLFVWIKIWRHFKLIVNKLFGLSNTDNNLKENKPHPLDVLSSVLVSPFRIAWRAITGGRYRAHVLGIKGYYWYVFRHAIPFAGCVYHDYKTSGKAPPDIIHAHDPDAALAAVLFKHLFGSRVLYDAHEYGPDAYVLWPEPRSIFRAYEKMIVGRADSAVTVSPILVDRYNAEYSNKPAFHLIPNASPKSAGAYSPPKEPVLQRLANGRIAVLFQGGFSKGRGVEWVIDEWSQAKPNNAALFIRGPNNQYREKLISHAAKTDLLDSSIFFLDSINEDDLIAEASAADIGLITYHSDIENHAGACPNKLSQYMLAGLAVLSTPIPFVSEIVKKAKCGLIYNDQQQGSFAEILIKLLENTSKIRELGDAGRAYALSSYNYDNYADTLTQLYENKQ